MLHFMYYIHGTDLIVQPLVYLLIYYYMLSFTQPAALSAKFTVCTKVMKIQTADRCNKKSSSFTNTRILSTKDNLTPRLQCVRKGFPLSNLAAEEIIDHNLKFHWGVISYQLRG